MSLQCLIIFICNTCWELFDQLKFDVLYMPTVKVCTGLFWTTFIIKLENNQKYLLKKVFG